MSYLALSASFEYLCYGSTAIINISLFQYEIGFRRQNLTSKVLKDMLFSGVHLTKNPKNKIKIISTFSHFRYKC